MSAASVEAISASKDIIANPLKESEGQEMKKRTNDDVELEEKREEKGSRGNADVDKREKVDDLALKSNKAIDLGPQLSVRLQTQEKKDENFKSIRKWSEELIGNIQISKDGDIGKNPEVQILSISIMCPGRHDIILSEPFASSPKACLFGLKEGCKYRLRFSFTVSNRAVIGLKYTNTLWKAGVRVDKSEVTLGTFKPRREPYAYELQEDSTPSGIFVRGLYCARTKVIDHQGKCYLDIKYYFEIQKNWPSPS